MQNTNINIHNNINDIFNNMSYNEEYNFDIWITIIIIILTIFITIYFYIQNLIKSQRPNWQKNKCNPLYMPFASSLETDLDLSNNFTQENFNECLNDLTFGISLDVKNPFNIIFAIFKNLFAFFATIVSQILSFFMYLLNLIFELFNKIIEKLKIILHQVNIVLIKSNSFINNIIYTLQHIYYTILVAVGLLRTLIVASITVISTSFLISGISQFTSIFVALGLHLFLAMILSTNIFTLPWGIIQWALFSVQLVLFLASLVYLILTILIHIGVVNFGNEIKKGTSEEEAEVD